MPMIWSGSSRPRSARLRLLPAVLSAAPLALTACGSDSADKPAPTSIITAGDFSNLPPVTTPQPADAPAPETFKTSTTPAERAALPENVLTLVPDERDPLSSNGAQLPPTPASTRPVPPAAPSTPPAPPTPPTPIVTRVGPPPQPNPKSVGTDQIVVIDALVGQVNGKPVFASDILEPLDGALRAAADRATDANAWRRSAAELIIKELRRRIEDELILAEARRGLSPEQKQGLFRFLEQVQQSLVSGSRGSSVAADEQLRESTGRSLKQEAQDRLDRELILKELRDRVVPRVVISWRDIQQEYERSYDKFNPPAVATLRLITVAGAPDAEAAQAITAQLASGTPFPTLAADKRNDFNAAEGGKLIAKFSGAYAEGDFSAIKEINDAARTLSIGQVAGPFTYTTKTSRGDVTRTAWVYLERIDKPEGVSLYDAQLAIDGDLREKRTSAEMARYFDQLRKRGNVSRIELMGEQLMIIATDRYAPRFRKS